MNPKEITLFIGLLWFSACTSKSPLAYLDASPPPETATVFAQGDISKKGVREGNVVLSPNGDLLLYIIRDSVTGPQIYQRSFQKGQWSSPERVSFSNQGENYEPFFTQDGNMVYFVSNRSTGEHWNGRIWKVGRKGNAWGEPSMLEIPVETDKGLWFPSVTPDGLVYFGASLSGVDNFGKSDIYSFDPSTKKVRNIKALNTPAEEWDPFISSDGSYMIFASDRPGGHGAVDHYISFWNGQGWETPINMGPTINSPDFDVAAKVTPDGKLILFDRPFPDDQDVYWIKADLIDQLRVQQ